MPVFDLQEIQKRMDRNPVKPPVPVRMAKPKPEFNLSIAEKEIAKLKELLEGDEK